jgi:hypothetical protein
VVTLGEDGREEIREIARLERTDLKPETLGLTLAEGKRILKDRRQSKADCRPYKGQKCEPFHRLF